MDQTTISLNKTIFPVPTLQRSERNSLSKISFKLTRQEINKTPFI